MNQQLVLGGIAGAVAITALGALAGYRIVDKGVDKGSYAAATRHAPTRTASASHEECSDQLVTVTRPPKDPNRIGGTVAGAVVGGLLGHEVGAGDGKKVATVGGAVAGGYAGNKVQEGMQERDTYQETRRVCKTVPGSG